MEKLSDLLEDSQVELERVRKRADKLDYQNKRLRAQLDLIEKQHRSSTQERLQEVAIPTHFAHIRPSSLLLHPASSFHQLDQEINICKPFS